MKVRGDANPGRFSVEIIPNRDGWCLCRFYENAKKYSETEDDGAVTTGWEYDEYHLPQQGAKESLETDIPANFDVYFAAAEATEAPTEIEQLRADVDFVMVLEGLL